MARVGEGQKEEMGEEEERKREVVESPRFPPFARDFYFPASLPFASDLCDSHHNDGLALFSPSTF